MADGIDVSGFNTVTSWSSVRATGIGFASVKVSQGTYYTSPTAAAQITGSRGAGVLTGGYHFGDPNSAAVVNADYFVAAARPLGVLGGGALLPMLDIENDQADNITWSAATANAFIPAWIARVRAVTGQARVAVYANLSFWQTLLRPNDWADANTVLWLALYNGDPANTGGFSHPRLGIHQHTETAVVSGVAGQVDRNATVGAFGLPDLTLGASPAPAPSPRKAVPTMLFVHDAAGNRAGLLLESGLFTGLPPGANYIAVAAANNVPILDGAASLFDDLAGKSNTILAALIAQAKGPSGALDYTALATAFKIAFGGDLHWSGSVAVNLGLVPAP